MASTTLVKLSNGYELPQFGLGSWQSKPEEVKLAVKTALDAGYRLIDTATVYQNETDIGDALKEYFESGKLKREDVFIVTKIWVNQNRPEDTEAALRDSLKKLQLDYVDLYLIHQPVTFDHEMKEHDKSVTVEDQWRGMEGVYEKKLARAIGVSNFNDSQIERIQKVAKVPIHNSQVELHLNFLQDKHVATCKKHNITVTAYAPLGSPGRSNFTLPTGQKLEWAPAPNPLENKNVLALAEKYKKSPAQILLRHLLQRGILVIPKSVTPSRIQENAQIFDFKLTDDEVAQLDKTPQGNRLFLQDFCEGHPEDPFADERKKQ